MVENASVKGTNDELDVVSVELAIARDSCQRLPIWIYPHFEQWEELIRWIDYACANRASSRVSKAT